MGVSTSRKFHPHVTPDGKTLLVLIDCTYFKYTLNAGNWVLEKTVPMGCSSTGLWHKVGTAVNQTLVIGIYPSSGNVYEIRHLSNLSLITDFHRES